MSLKIEVASGEHDSPVLIESGLAKKHGYFDEKITVFVFVNDDLLARSQVELEIVYDNGERIQCELASALDKNAGQFWIWKGFIKPKKACSRMTFYASYKQTSDVKDEIELEKYQQVRMLDFNGIYLCEDLVDSKNSINSTNTRFSCEYSILVSSLFRMSMRAINIINGRRMACLEIATSRSITSNGIDIAIENIKLECDNWSFKPLNDIKYPLTLQPSTKLVLAYQINNTDNHTMKPISCVISSTVNRSTKIKTIWVTNIDLNEVNPHHLQPQSASASNLPLPSVSKHNKELKMPKFRQSQSSPLLKSTKQRSSSHIVGMSSNEKLTSQRHFSLRQVSSATSLSTSSLANSLNSKRGLKIKVSGPTIVKLGEKFRWKLELSNQSPDKMELIIYVQSSINKEYEKSFPPIPIQSGPAYDPVPLFSNQQLVRNFYYKFNKSGIVSLSNHLRVPLDCGSLFETELQLVGYEKGLFNLYDLRIVDVLSGVVFECGKLLDVSIV